MDSMISITSARRMVRKSRFAHFGRIWTARLRRSSSAERGRLWRPACSFRYRPARASKVRVGAASRSAFRASIGLVPSDLRGHVLGALAGGFKRGRRIGAYGGAQRLAGVGMTEAIGERACAVGSDAQDESSLAQICDLEPAVTRWPCSAERVGQNLAHGYSLRRKSLVWSH